MPPSENERRWENDFLNEEWNKMYDYSFYKNHFESIDVQCVLLLLEGAISHFKTIGTSYSALKHSQKELLVRLERKNDECLSLKGQLEKSTKMCGNCSALEKALNDAKRESKDYRDQVDGIARILNARNLNEPNADRKSAFDLVSQMILGSSPSPKRKKPLVERESRELPKVLQESPIVPAAPESSKNEEVRPTSGTSSRKAQIPFSSPNLSHIKILPTTKSPTLNISIVPTRTKCTLSRSCDNGEPSSKIIQVKKNLTCDLESGTNFKKTETDFKLKLPPLKESSRRRRKVNTGKTLELWSQSEDSDEEKNLVFDKTTFISETPEGPVDERQKENSPVDIIVETPLADRTDRKFWKLKERGSIQKESRGGRKFRQMKLMLEQKKSHSKVDLLEAVQWASCGKTIPEKDNLTSSETDVRTSKKTVEELIASAKHDITDFNPVATSTQMIKAPPRTAESSREPKATTSGIERDASGRGPKHVYVTGPVRKKEEKKKLSGWECKECEQYYQTLGKEMDAEDLKKRMNACSKHRMKFRPKLDETPPEFWKIVAPDTEEFKGYSSIYEYRE